MYVFASVLCLRDLSMLLYSVVVFPPPPLLGIISFIHCQVDGQLECFQIFTIMNKGKMTIFYTSFDRHMQQYFCCAYTQKYNCWVIWVHTHDQRIAQNSFQFTLLSAMCDSQSSSTSLSTLNIVSSFNFSQACGCVVVFYYGFHMYC